MRKISKHREEGSIVVSTWLVTIFVFGDGFELNTKAKQSEIPPEKSMLTLMDFGYEKNEDKDSYDYKNSYIEFDERKLAQRTKYSYKSGDSSLEYTIFKSKYPWLIKFDENRVIFII